eukprot:353608-Chlamydomonas_euryale.AAC.9
MSLAYCGSRLMRLASQAPRHTCVLAWPLLPKTELHYISSAEELQPLHLVLDELHSDSACNDQSGGRPCMQPHGVIRTPACSRHQLNFTAG